MRPLLSTLTLCACLAGGVISARAQEVELLAPPHQAPGPRGGHPRGLFVSPCGQPFRAGPGEAYPVAAWFAQADADHDGVVDHREFLADAMAFFAVLDANHDRVIDGAEVADYEHRLVPEIMGGGRPMADDGRIILVQMGGGGGMGGGMGGGGGGGHGRRGGQKDEGGHRPGPTGTPVLGVAPFGLLGEPEPVTAADTDFNGRITAAEFTAAADRRFARLDADGDRKLILAELPKTPIQSMGARGMGGKDGDGEGRGERHGRRPRDDMPG